MKGDLALLENATYGLFYVDLSAGAKGQRLMLATSSDGLNFTHMVKEPILESEQKGVWILDPEVHKSSSGGWNLYYSLMGVPGEAGIRVPVIMRSVIDPGCLLSGISG